ncbi:MULTISPECIES: pyridoxine/pyridoxamine 5'-phosphate oxidase [Legionella]|uniref:Pyridoxamine 5'-phosphate oxidase family protein n=1 Tax=Legionella resiliens TaxID=2905958 RepID=A0ABS8X5G0_9GAMM|nr:MULTISPECIES: pyridoxamine 5'-phosphate oxidase family protein [unclassified Legionella]MCE0723433.1 pyridoxamine 5'-phosphate oxidase family protein [Legionella sp. 9fVS26]MCE3532587.1 pyridoxamine 5'-phosphate oxidase family protein [Legionella sp. 8cVS16]QLZ68720.1 pyridoxal 5'-phosphate synthase [Legionella sp. PC1000]
MQTNPIIELSLWLASERETGAPNPNHAVLSSTSLDGAPHSRVVAIRDISDEGILFFTQKSTRKVSELKNNPQVSLVFWLELLQREVIIEGKALLLKHAENQYYWSSYPQWAQIRFLSYAPTSMQIIESKEILEDKRQKIEDSFLNKLIPVSPEYCGFRIQPERMVFYAYRQDELSDVWEYVFKNNEWHLQRLSP